VVSRSRSSVSGTGAVCSRWLQPQRYQWLVTTLQLSHQTGTSDSLIKGSENSQATNATRGASMMMSAAENYAKANISTQEAYNQLMSKSVEGSVNAGASGKFNTGDQAFRENWEMGNWSQCRSTSWCRS
jgi:hypothetical protein